MPKRVRKAEEEDVSKKKPKAGGEEPAVIATRKETSSPARHVVASNETFTSRKTKSTPQIAKEPEEDTVGNPYEDTRAASLTEKKETPPPPAMKTSVPVVVVAPPSNKETSGKTKVEPVVLNGNVQPVTKKRTNPTSVPCILLFLVAILMWCTVTLLGLLLSERMEHELQVWHLRDMVYKSKEEPQVTDLEQNVKHWKGVAEKLESEKKGMLREFGDTLASLEYME
jgi:hypothetical protein